MRSIQFGRLEPDTPAEILPVLQLDRDFVESRARIIARTELTRAFNAAQAVAAAKQEADQATFISKEQIEKAKSDLRIDHVLSGPHEHEVSVRRIDGLWWYTATVHVDNLAAACAMALEMAARYLCRRQ